MATRKTTTASKTTAHPSAAEQLKEYQRKRDFEKTREPSGVSTDSSREPASSHTAKVATKRPAKRTAKSTAKSTAKRASSRAPAAQPLRFVIQKHDASQLHYDLRLEIDGVMKSWAVPKGPSADPSVKRLAMQVEDHPIAYNSFEGTIPKGEYGGGTVMLWDNGTYEIENPPADDDDPNTIARHEYDRGEMKVVFHGKRIKGSYALVRTKGMRGNSAKPSWLLIKHRDAQARPEADTVLTEKYTTSVTTHRSMDEISEES
jgi:bifunctional non-homologous end joining protein LigD